MITCPECGALGEVTDSRPNEVGVRRRRRCPSGHRFTTQEIILSEYQKQVEEAVDEVMNEVYRAAERARDRARNRNRG